MSKPVYILGINGGVRPGYQDIAAVLMCNGKVVAAIEEERLNRIKHDAGHLPVLSVKEVLRIAGISIQDVGVVGFHGSTWHAGIDETVRQHFENYFGYCPPVKRYHHHTCHAASAYYASGFNQALIITVDGSGDAVSTQVMIGKNGSMELLFAYERPQSLGFFYSMITQLCGFTRDGDEYKLMGLAAFGNAANFKLDNILEVNDGGYRLNTDYMAAVLPGQPAPGRYEMAYSEKLCDETGLKRRFTKDITQRYKDLAASAQLQLEKALLQLVKKYVAETGIRKVCLAGGVALNCLANQKIEALEEVESLFIQPAANDAGISLGAAYLAGIEAGLTAFSAQTHTYLGNEFTNEEVLEALNNCREEAAQPASIVNDAAALLNAGKVLGWFQGKMEFGPRALGNRSILANPSTTGIQQTVNHKIKFREGFRPFGASVLQEDFHTYFEAKCDEAPYMTKVFKVKNEYKELLAGVTHVDGTCRVQTVNRAQNELYYDLIAAFKKQSDFGVLLNTSFNLNHEPIVCTPREAIASYHASGLDALFMGNYKLIRKG